MKLRTTPELKVATKIANLVNDLTLDLDQIGVHLANDNAVTFRRVMEIAEAAKYEKDERIHNDDYLF
jgi:hypothetical protein